MRDVNRVLSPHSRGEWPGRLGPGRRRALLWRGSVPAVRAGTVLNRAPFPRKRGKGDPYWAQLTDWVKRGQKAGPLRREVENPTVRSSGRSG